MDKRSNGEAPIAVVTGGGQGIGRVFCLALAGSGYHVLVADRNIANAQAVARAASESGGVASAVEIDVAGPESVDRAFSDILSRHGRVDVLVNNAALFSTLAVKPFDQLSLQEWQSVLDVNVTGVFLCSRAVVPAMRKAGFGRIVNIGSGAARMGRPNYLHYIASKGAVEAMSRSMARELGAEGITVNVIAPGAIFTEIPRATVTDVQKQNIVAAQCIPRPGAPDDLVSTLLHIVSPASAFVTGQTFLVDGGVIHG